MPSAFRLVSGLVVVATGAWAVPQWIYGSTSWPLMTTAAGLVVAYALIDSLLGRRTGRSSIRALPPQPAPEHGPDDDASAAGLSCPAGIADCWVVDAMQGLMTVAQDTAPKSGLSQAVDNLARRACDLVDADAAWVYGIEGESGQLSLLSSHLQPRIAKDWELLSARAEQFAAESVRALGRRDPRRSHISQLSRAGEYIRIPLLRRRRVLGLLVVHTLDTDGPPSPMKEDLLVSLASQTTVTLENTLLYETQRDIDAKLKQFELHRTDYVATLSHELRTPLTSIKGFAQLLIRNQEMSAEAAREYASTIAAEADKLALIVNDIVDLTRMETGLLDLHRKPVLLGRLIRGVVRRIQPMAAGQQLRTLLPERLPAVRVDPERLDQVLDRLLVDALGQSYARSDILLAVEAGDEGVTVRLEYRTTEARIETLAQALKGFAQTSGDGQATQLGRGRLGLYICRNFIEAHGGKMWIECPEEQVARVVFTLPY